jgi:putative ABC transport system ATP-binding protein
MTEPIIQVSGLGKDFQLGHVTVRALVDVDLTIAPQTFTVVMGPSGSGKSTLLYLLGGLDRPTRGQIRVGGQNIEKLDENQLAVFRRRQVGFIFQSFNLVASMSAIQNVAFPMRFARVGGRKRLARAAALLERVHLADRAHHRPNELSGGQQQRVAVARALVNDPGLILADEPTGNLDTASGASIMHLLAELHRSGRTVVVVTHDTRMQNFATHCVYLLDGRIVSAEEYEKSSQLAVEDWAPPPELAGPAAQPQEKSL